MTPEEYLKSPNPVCVRCSTPKPDVRMRLNHYLNACGLDKNEAMELLCGDCSHQLWLDS